MIFEQGKAFFPIHMGGINFSQGFPPIFVLAKTVRASCKIYFSGMLNVKFMLEAKIICVAAPDETCSRWGDGTLF